jgi:hypothetical protein
MRRVRLSPLASVRTRALVCLITLVGFVGVGIPQADAATTVFSDGFESGNLAGYQVMHSGVQQSLVHTGAWAWRATSTGQPSYAYRLLPSSYPDITVTAWVYIVSNTGSVKLLALRRNRGQSIDVYVDQHNRVSLRNNIGRVTTYSKTTMATGGWHKLALHAVVGSGTGAVDVSLDGSAVPGLTLTGQQLGTLAFDELRLGDLAGRTYDIAIDDVTMTAS